MSFKFEEGAQVFKGLTQSESIGLRIVDTPGVGEVTDSVAETTSDRTYKVRTTVDSGNNGILDVDNVGLTTPLEYTNLTPQYALLDEQTRIITYVSNGLSEILVKNLETKEQKRIEHIMRGAGDTKITFTQNYIAGSLGEHVLNAINALILGKSPGDTYQAYFTSNTQTTVEISPLNLLSGFYDNFTSVLRDDRTDTNYPCSLVTNRHALCAKHVAPPVGTLVTFKTPAGVYISATVELSQQVSKLRNGLVYAVDCSVLYFDKDINEITPAKTLPLGFAPTYLTSMYDIVNSNGDDLSYPGTLPTLSRQHHSSITELNKSYVQIKPFTQGVPPIGRIYNVFEDSFSIDNLQDPFFDTLSAWGIDSIGGDSGSPCMMLINNELILMGHQHTTQTAVDIAEISVEINEIMNTQAGTIDIYSLEQVDLTMFTQYS